MDMKINENDKTLVNIQEFLQRVKDLCDEYNIHTEKEDLKSNDKNVKEENYEL